MARAWSVRRPLTRVLGHGGGRFTSIRRFVILGTPRAGSTVLEHLLDSHPQIVCDGELLAPRVGDPIGHLEGRAVLARCQGADAWGFRLMSQHVEWWYRPALVQELRRRGYLVVHLERSDLLVQAMCNVVSNPSGRFHFYPGEQPESPSEVDPAGLIAAIHHAGHYRDRARSLAEADDTISVNYEDDLHDPNVRQRTADTIVRALGLDLAPVATDVTSTVPLDAFSQVSNRDELVAALRAVRLGHMAARYCT